MSRAKKITLSEASRNFSDFINRVAYRGERFILIKGRKPVAELGPVVTGRKLGDLIELLRGLPRLDDDTDFGADLRNIRRAMNKGTRRDPWAS